jgi:hypothetical protein
MDKVFVTLKLQHNIQKDVALPADVPSQFVAEALTKAFGIQTTAGNVCVLEVLSSTEPARKITPARSLAEAYVLCGSYLQLTVEAPTPGNGTFLVSSNGVRFPLSKPVIQIGRPVDRSQVVDVDLSPLDTQRVVSRQHALLRQEGGRAVLVDSSKNGTWVNDKRLLSGVPCPLQPGDQIFFGPKERGVMLRYQTES